ncbi:hypothetical protein QQX98_008232 [Neonectria punicea]|uniref:Ubiquitin-like protease family profile domain-containing protein n=1 Tax=Neonectria punicea TaxID=979145 RepID=A0ABR1GW11_9HYPO
MNSRLKVLNGSMTPKSSMGHTLNAGTIPHKNPARQSDLLPERPAKRQKQQDREYKERYSKYFPPKASNVRKDSIEDISEDEPKFEPRNSIPEIHDLTQDGSQADTVELGSATSAGKSSAASGLPEYRNAIPKNLGANRRARRSRILNGGSGSRDGDRSLSSRDHLTPSVTTFSGTSPDVLARDPSPVRIVSDILPASPKLVITNQPRTKRVRISAERRSTDVESEDELSRPGLHVSQLPGKKSNNFSGIPRTNKHRADIPRTQFLSSKPGAKGSKAMPDRPPIQGASIVSAISGKFQYPKPNEPERQLKFRFEQSVARATYEDEGTTRYLPWLDVQRTKVQSISHATTHSQFVIIKRSTTNEAPGGGNLAIEFKHVQDVPLFMCWLCETRVIPTTEKSAEDLQKQFKKAFEEAEKYSHSHGANRVATKLPASSPPGKVQPRPRTQEPRRDPFHPKPDPPAEKLKDKMRGPVTDVLGTPAREDDSVSVVTRSQGPETRRTRKTSPPPPLRERTPERWTLLNPEWDKNWHRSLVYPATGKDRATVDRDDILRLDEGEFLNDNLISFYFRYLQVGLQKDRPEILQKVHFFNTFFFAKLRSTRGNINYDGVKSWTARVDLLSYKYIVVPVNENMHWYLAIIYNAPRMFAQDLEQGNSAGTDTIDVEETASGNTPKTSPVERAFETISLDDTATKQPPISQSSSSTVDTLVPSSPTKPSNGTTFKGGKRKSLGGTQKFSPEEPKIITLDSLGGGHSVTCRHLKDYLVEEARHKKNIDLAKVPGGMTAKKIPEQNNYCDCGVFLLGYMEEFLKDPDEAVRRILQKEDLEWNIQPSRIRAKVRDLVFKLQSEQEARLEAEKERKRRLRKVTKESTMSSGPSAAPSSQSSPREPPQSSKTPPSKPGVSSPLGNSVGSKAVLALQQVMAAPPSPRTSSSPPKPGPLSTPKLDEDHEFIRLLEDDSSLGKASLSGGEVFHSARSSPQGRSQVPVDLTTETPTNSTGSTSNSRSQPVFVQKLPSSPLNAQSANSPRRRLKRDRSTSPEVTFIASVQSKPAPVQSRERKPSQEVLPSIESDRPTTSGPQYDGIDRSLRVSP